MRSPRSVSRPDVPVSVSSKVPLPSGVVSPYLNPRPSVLVLPQISSRARSLLLVPGLSLTVKGVQCVVQTVFPGESGLGTPAGDIGMNGHRPLGGWSDSSGPSSASFVSGPRSPGDPQEIERHCQCPGVEGPRAREGRQTTGRVRTAPDGR